MGPQRRARNRGRLRDVEEQGPSKEDIIRPASESDTAVTLPTGDTGAIAPAPLTGRIAFGVGTDLDTTELSVVGANGSGLSQLTDNAAAGFDPSWSPDGSHIVY